MTVKELCQKYDITQTELSRRFGIPLRTVQGWYGETRTPPQYIVDMLEELLETARNTKPPR